MFIQLGKSWSILWNSSRSPQCTQISDIGPYPIQLNQVHNFTSYSS